VRRASVACGARRTAAGPGPWAGWPRGRRTRLAAHDSGLAAADGAAGGRFGSAGVAAVAGRARCSVQQSLPDGLPGPDSTRRPAHGRCTTVLPVHPAYSSLKRHRWWSLCADVAPTDPGVPALTQGHMAAVSGCLPCTDDGGRPQCLDRVAERSAAGTTRSLQQPRSGPLAGVCC
jgi:hypothetical protein